METVETKLAVHEAICSERYNSIDRSLRDGDKRMTKIEYLLYGVIVCVLCAVVRHVCTVVFMLVESE